MSGLIFGIGFLLGGFAGLLVWALCSMSGRSSDQSKIDAYLAKMQLKHGVNLTDPETVQYLQFSPPVQAGDECRWIGGNCAQRPGSWGTAEMIGSYPLRGYEYRRPTPVAPADYTCEEHQYTRFSPVASSGKQPDTGEYQKSLGNDCAGGTKLS